MFGRGISLVSAAIDGSMLHPGGSVGLRMAWLLEPGSPAPDPVAVWVHAMAADGRTAFQGDHPLTDDLRCPPAGEGLEGGYPVRFTIPEGTPPGRYELRAGLWMPNRRSGIGLRKATLPHGGTFVTIGTVTVTPPG